jgi:Kef-type K+ transport system membrane component KefB
MVPRGEVGLIVALVGLQMTAISEQAYAVVIFMTAMTTLVAPPLLKVLFRDEAITMARPMEPQQEPTAAMK